MRVYGIAFARNHEVGLRFMQSCTHLGVCHGQRSLWILHEDSLSSWVCMRQPRFGENDGTAHVLLGFGACRV